MRILNLEQTRLRFRHIHIYSEVGIIRAARYPPRLKCVLLCDAALLKLLTLGGATAAIDGATAALDGATDAIGGAERRDD